MDNGPVSRAKVFQSVMGSLGVRVLTHMPPRDRDRRTPARAKGKVERPFRTDEAPAVAVTLRNIPRVRMKAYKVRLDEYLRRKGGLAGPLPTAEEFRGVIATLSMLYIRAEHQLGQDVQFLDRVINVLFFLGSGADEFAAGE